jgi:hypothetical protein
MNIKWGFNFYGFRDSDHFYWNGRGSGFLMILEKLKWDFWKTPWYNKNPRINLKSNRNKMHPNNSKLISNSTRNTGSPWSTQLAGIKPEINREIKMNSNKTWHTSEIHICTFLLTISIFFQLICEFCKKCSVEKLVWLLILFVLFLMVNIWVVSEGKRLWLFRWNSRKIRQIVVFRFPLSATLS